nr:uncharacterized protein LOC123760774 [Procambarus clarkii]
MAVHVVVAVLAAAAILMPVRAVPASSFLNCFMAGANPAMTTMPVGPAFDLNVNVLCPATCLQQGFAYAGITEGTHCFCSSDVSTLTVAGTCDELCTDGTLQCGAIDSNVVAVFSTGGGSPNFTFVASNTAASITVTLTPVAAGTTYLIDLGVQAPPSYANQTTLTTDPYLVPGVYHVQVLSMIEGTSLMASGSTSLLQTGVPSVDQVGCPIVWEPSEVFYCNVSVSMANASNSFTGTFSDDASQFAITGIGSEVYRRGTPPPRGLSPSVAAPDSTVDEIRKPFSVTKPSKLLAFDMYAYDVGAFTVSVKRPACSGGVYSVDAGGCVSVPPDDPLGITHTCPATDVFWPQQPTCSSAAGVALSATPATWSDLAGTLVSGTFAAAGFHRELLAAPVDLLPGDAIAIIGPVGKSLEVRTVGDTVAGAATTSLHYLSAIIKEMMPIQLSHSCTTVNLDVDLQVADDYGVATTLVNTTSCERNITDVALKVSQTLTTTFNTSVNVQQPFYVRSLTDANYTAVFSVAGPVSFTFSFLPSLGLNYTFNDTGDYPLGTVLYELTYPIMVSVDGMYIVTVAAQNKHNIYTGPVTNSTIVYVQHEVVTTWQVAPVLPGGVLVPTNTPQIQFTDTSGAPFPTNASVSVAWGDGLTEDLPFLNPGNNVPIFSHIYANDGYFNITAYIHNIVSGYTVTCQIYIVQEIINFVVLNKYYPTLTATVGRDGFGKLKNQYPMDKNLTFVPLMTQGTVDEYIVINDTSGLEMFRYKTLDPFNPTLLPYSYFINYETVVNMTVHAVNKFQSVPYLLYVEIVGTIRQCLIDDYSDVKPKNEEKTFEVSFESVGAGTCLVVDWGDTDLKVVHSYGESYTCQTGYGSAVYHDAPVLDVSFNLTHTYTWDDVFNVTIYAFNNLGSCVSRVMTLVTSIKCRPPILAIEDGSASFEAPIQFYKSKVNTIYTIASLNCELTSNTRKRWQLYLTNATTGDLLEYIPTMYVYSSWDKPQLSIPARRLDYNLYIAWYTLTMWDPAVLDPSWPFQKRSMTYFEITKTPLVPVLMENAVSLVLRGLPQQVLFNPANFSSDPDYPDDKNFTVEYRCRQVGEAWPAPDTTPHSVSVKGSGGGCFGNGPGLLDYTAGELVLFGSDFVAVDLTYEMEATISKDTRTAKVVGYVQVVSYIPPVISMRCASASLCTPYPDGVYINPSSRVGLMAQCEQDCTSSLTYSWEVSSDTGTVFPADPDHFPVGVESAEVALSTKFFDDNPTLSILHFSITATGSDGTQGLVAYFMKVNKRPVNGYCNVTVPPTRLALVDQFTLTCDSWQDPEGIGITNYIVTIVGVDGAITTLLNMRHGGTPPQVEPLVLPPGTFTIMVQIFDEWGAFTYVNTGTIEVLMPSKAALDAANIPGLIAMLKGSGDTQLLNMVLLAQSRVADQIGEE